MAEGGGNGGGGGDSGDGGDTARCGDLALLANIYLHYALDLWARQWRHRHARGNVVVVRGACPRAARSADPGADDLVAGFQYQADATRFLTDLRERLESFALSLHPDKTRLIEFGRFAAANRERRGLGKPESFNFLGFTRICGRTRNGKFALRRKTRRDRLRAKLRELKETLRRRLHAAIDEQGAWLRQVVRGYFAYRAVPNNIQALAAFPARDQMAVGAAPPPAQPKGPPYPVGA